MYLGLTDLAKGLLGGGVSAGNTNGLINSKGGDHYYTRGDITERGPCPGLNALANQGYLFVNQKLLLRSTLTHAVLAMAETLLCLKSKKLCGRPCTWTRHWQQL